MDTCGNSMCDFNEIKEIIKNPEIYFIEDNIYQIIEIGTNLLILLNKKNPSYIESKILDYLSYFFSHRYLVIKVKINDKFKDYTIGLGEDTDRMYTEFGETMTKTQLYIPDWSVYSDYSKYASGITHTFKGTERNMYIGKCIISDKLNRNQINYLIDIHKYLFLREYITHTKKYYILIDLPFLYSNLGFLYSHLYSKYKKKTILNCRDFVYFFRNSPEWLCIMTIDRHHLIDTELEDWTIVKKTKFGISNFTVHFSLN